MRRSLPMHAAILSAFAICLTVLIPDSLAQGRRIPSTQECAGLLGPEWSLGSKTRIRPRSRPLPFAPLSPFLPDSSAAALAWFSPRAGTRYDFVTDEREGKGAVVLSVYAYASPVAAALTFDEIMNGAHVARVPGPWELGFIGGARARFLLILYDDVIAAIEPNGNVQRASELTSAIMRAHACWSP